MSPTEFEVQFAEAARHQGIKWQENLLLPVLKVLYRDARNYAQWDIEDIVKRNLP